MATNKRINRAAMAQLDEALHAVADCDRAVWTLKKSIGECRSALGAGSFASTAAEARAIARALAMCARSIDAAVASALAESVAAAEKAPGGSVARGSSSRGARTNSRDGGGSGVGSVATTPAARVRPTSAPLDMDSPAAARLVAAARETVTIHLVRPARKPPRAAVPATPDENGRVNNDDDEDVFSDDDVATSAAGRPPVGPARAKPVPFQFQRRVREGGGGGGVDVDAAGAGAFRELLPAIQEKLGLATPVVEVAAAADGVARRSDADFVDGEVCVVYSAADGRRRRSGRGDGAASTVDDSIAGDVGQSSRSSRGVVPGTPRAREMRRDSLARLAAPSARASRVVVNLIPTSLRRRALEGRLGASDDDDDEGAKPWTEVTLPASCSTRVEALRRCEDALYRAERIVTPLLGLYAGDGTHLEGVEGLKNGDVLLYRTAKEPVPDSAGAGDTGESRAMRRARAASLAAPKAEWSQSFEVSVARVGEGGAEGGAESIGARRMRLPTRGLENMSLSQLSRRIRMACALSPDTDVEAVYAMPAAERVEHPAQLAGVAVIAYALEGDEPPRKPPPSRVVGLRRKKVNASRRVSASGVGGRGGGGGDGDGGGTVFRPASARRPTTAPPLNPQPSTKTLSPGRGFGFGSTVRFAGDEYLPSAMAKTAKESSKKAARTQATQLQLGTAFDGLVTSAITPRSSAEKLLVNNPMGRKTRPTPTPPTEPAESVDASSPPVRERWVDVEGMDACTMSAKNAAAAAAWAEYHERNAWPSPELRRIAELGYVPAPGSPAPAEPTSRHLQG